MLGFKKNNDNLDDEVSKIIKQYESVRNYKTSMGFTNDWAKFIDFMEDRQWIYTDKNKNMPKPQHNIIKFSKRSKVSSVLSDIVKVVFSPLENVEQSDIAIKASEIFNHAIEQNNDEIDQERLDYEVVSDAFTLGTGFSHFYWDDEVVGGYNTLYKGSMSGHALDPMDVFPGNPQEKDKDKQPFWIITYRELIDVIKRDAKNNGIPIEKIEMIVGDKDNKNDSYDASKNEVSGEDKTTVYMKYWRDIDDNKIYFSKCTKNLIFKPKTAQWDYDGIELEPYPINCYVWEERKKSIFGIGEVEGMIYNQKAINFISAMQILNVQDTGWSKYIVKFDALKKDMQNIPGEVVKDESGQPGDNIKAMQPAQMSNQAFQLFDNMIQNTRIFNGVAESVTGESYGANMSASAIIALQNQAKVPLDANKRAFKRYKKREARIKEFFFKTKYNLPRTVKIVNDEGISRNETFTGTDYREIPLELRIDVGSGGSYSESLAVATLDKFLEKNLITAEQYAELAPDNIMPFREKFKKLKEKEKQDQLKMAMDAMQKQQATIQGLQTQVLDHRNALQKFTQPGMPKDKPKPEVGGKK